jgi:hypothetical protein
MCNIIGRNEKSDLMVKIIKDYLCPVWLHGIGLGIKESRIGPQIPLFGCAQNQGLETEPQFHATHAREQTERPQFPSS